jgi:hypothetical protein
MLDDEGLRRRTMAAGLVMDAFAWRKHLSWLLAFMY